MYETLNKLLRNETNPVSACNFIAIDRVSTGVGIANLDFLTHHFVSLYLKNQWKVCVVSCSQTFMHHKVIQQKLGNNLPKLMAEQKYQIVAVPRLFLDLDGLCCQSTRKICGEAEGLGSSEICEMIYDKLYSALESIKTQGEKTPCLLVLDDLTSLTDIGLTSADILLFICKIRAKMSEYFSTLLTTCCRFDPEVFAMERCSLANQLVHWSCLSFTVDDLSTGVSKDVHGQLIVRWMMKSKPERPKEERYHYKITERDLHVFAIGTLPIVL